jgi:hypothetical protein
MNQITVKRDRLSGFHWHLRQRCGGVSHTLVIEDELFEFMQRVSAEDAVEEKRVVLDVSNRFVAVVGIDDDYATHRKFNFLREHASAQDDAVRVAHHVLDVLRTNRSLALPCGAWCVGEGDDVGHGLPQLFRDHVCGTPGQRRHWDVGVT